jgi:hypothetical protein
MRWLLFATRITYLCKLIGMTSFAAFPQLELFRVNFYAGLNTEFFYVSLQ